MIYFRCIVVYTLYEGGDYDDADRPVGWG